MRRGAWGLTIAAALAAGPAAGQWPGGGAPTAVPNPIYPLLVPPAPASPFPVGLPAATDPVLPPSAAPAAPPAAAPAASATPAAPGGKDYFGPPLSNKFDEKTIFPDHPPALKKKDPDLPPAGKPIVLSDGTVLPPPPSLPPPPKLWVGGLEFGANGSSGNADVLNLRFGANVDRKADDNRFHTDALYTLNRESHITKSNQAFLNSREEILLGHAPWSAFTALQVEYDEFRDYQFRVGTYAGLSYLWLKSDSTFLTTRFGAGAVRELSHAAQTPNRWVPEGLLGGDFNHRFTDRQGFVSSIDFYPNLSQIGQFRVRLRTAYEIVLDPAHGMLLRFGVQDRYDSSPGTALRNDVNYFTSLMFKF